MKKKQRSVVVHASAKRLLALASVFLFAAILLASIAPTVSADPGWWDTDWQYRKMVTIDHTKVDSELENFPVLVKIDSISDLNFSKVAGSSGEDIRFVASDDSTELKYEIERWDNSNNKAEIWVKIPTVSNSADTEFYMYYGNSGASDGQDAENVWDDNFKMVQHLQETSKTGGYDYDDHLDSTRNNNDGEVTGASMDATGKIDGADDFDGDTDFVKVPDDGSLDMGTGGITVEAWIKTSAQVPYGYWPMIVDKDRCSPRQGYRLFLSAESERICFAVEIDNNIYQTWGSVVNDGNWHYVAGVRDGNEVFVYKDLGRSGGTRPGADGNVNNNVRLSLSDGEWSPGKYYFDGMIDEVRVSNSVRSGGWLTTSYHSGSDSLLSFGAEEGELCTGCQRWYLSSTGGSYVMYKGDETQTAGTVTVSDDGEQIWKADEAASCDVGFAAGTWTGHLTFDASSSDTTVRVWVGKWDSSTFSPSAAGENATVSGSSDFSISASAIDVPKDEWLAFKIHDYDTDADGNSADVSVGLSNSYLTSGETDPGYPVPELPTLILFSVGLLVLAGYVWIRK